MKLTAFNWYRIAEKLGASLVSVTNREVVLSKHPYGRIVLTDNGNEFNLSVQYLPDIISPDVSPNWKVSELTFASSVPFTPGVNESILVYRIEQTLDGQTIDFDVTGKVEPVIEEWQDLPYVSFEVCDSDGKSVRDKTWGEVISDLETSLQSLKLPEQLAKELGFDEEDIAKGLSYFSLMEGFGLSPNGLYHLPFPKYRWLICYGVPGSEGHWVHIDAHSGYKGTPLMQGEVTWVAFGKTFHGWKAVHTLVEMITKLFCL